MKELFRTVFGSNLYGTNLPTSDTDYKGIYIPDARDILMQQAPKTSQTSNTHKGDGRNGSDDVDIELYTIQAFIRLCDDGQTNAVEMLFSPKDKWIKSSTEWEYLVANRSSLIHSGTSAFVGYCKTQAAKYCTKGSRVIAAKTIVDFLSCQDQRLKLVDTAIVDFVINNPVDGEISIVQHKIQSGIVPHLVVCNRMCPLHFSVVDALKIYKRVYDEYGKRVKQTMDGDGIDWKALMHAVRIAEEAKELLLYGDITLPRPNADVLKDIRVGNIKYEVVQDMIEGLLYEVETAHKVSILPKTIDRERWAGFVESCHLSQVMDRYGLSRNPTRAFDCTTASLKQIEQYNGYRNGI